MVKEILSITYNKFLLYIFGQCNKTPMLATLPHPSRNPTKNFFTKEDGVLRSTFSFLEVWYWVIQRCWFTVKTGRKLKKLSNLAQVPKWGLMHRSSFWKYRKLTKKDDDIKISLSNFQKHSQKSLIFSQKKTSLRIPQVRLCQSSASNLTVLQPVLFELIQR